MVRVTLTLEGTRHARVRASVLDHATYDAFKAATEGVVYHRGLGARVATFSQIGEIIARLRTARGEDGAPLFSVSVADELTAARAAHGAEQWLDAKAVKDRIVKIDDELFRATAAKNGGVGHRLYPFQRDGAMWLAIRDAALLADDMGLGKTLQTIAAIPSNAPVMVVCPAAVKGEWVGELAKWRPHVGVRVLQGRDSFRWPASGEILITNYDILPDIHDRKKCDGFLPAKPCRACKTVTVRQLTNSVKVLQGHLPTCNGKSVERDPCPGCHPLLQSAAEGTVFVLDEIHFVKNARTGRGRKAKALSGAVGHARGRRWGLSGTPLENTPRELWNVLDVLDLAETAFGNYKAFLKMFDATPRPFGGFSFALPDEDEFAEAFKKVALRRLKADVLPDLPTKQWRDHVVTVDRKTLKTCEEFIVKEGGLAHVIDLLERDTFPFEKMSSIREALAVAKIPALLEYVDYLEEQGEPVVVFSAHVAPIAKLAERPGWAAIMGDVSSAGKTDAKTRFQDGWTDERGKKHFLKGLACTIRSGGQGLTLTRASHAVFVDLDWKSTANAQAEDRLLRIGQKKSVLITRLIADHPLDRRVMEVLAGKAQMIRGTVDASTTSGESPIAKDVDALIARVETELATGSARRRASTKDEHAAFDALGRLVFETRADERAAESLLEEHAALGGLTDGQWLLVARVVTKGMLPPSLAPPAKSDNPARVLSGKPVSLSTKPQDEPMPRVPPPPSSSPPPSRTAHVAPDDLPALTSRGQRVILLMKSMSEDERADVNDHQSALWCLTCGEAPPHDDPEACPLLQDEGSEPPTSGDDGDDEEGEDT